MLNKFKFFDFTLVAFSVIGITANAQNRVNPDQLGGDLQLNTITTAVPFLTISPDSRSGALGDAGVSSSPDVNSIHWNPAKMAFMEDESGVAMSYSPWLRNLVGDISLSYLSGYYKLKGKGVMRPTIGGSLRYFSLGEITFTDENAQIIDEVRPNEWALDFAYAMPLSENFSFGMAVRYINSNLTTGLDVQGQSTRPGRSVAADVSAYYENDRLQLGDYNATLRAGVNISNIGAKMSYTDNDENDFLPTNLRIGPSLTLDFDDYNSITFIAEANKLLVPTPPAFLTDAGGTVLTDANGDPIMIAGKDPEVSVASGILQSFSDAPGIVESVDPNTQEATIQSGSILKEELNEINLSGGLEYWYDKQFAVRMGYFYEHPTKGNRQYFTMGLGLRMTVFGIDISYLVGNAQQNPLANTVRFSLSFNFDAFKGQNEDI
ncbi:MAG: hypothetical protein CMO34_00115 [Verrucomicrobia bacterium]|nr:hypothetical protein [Verrucomicrobiota bacterium]